MLHIIFIAIFTILTLNSTTGRSQTTACKTVIESPGVKYAYPRISADKKQILYQCNDSGKWALCIYNLESAQNKILLKDTFNNYFADLSMDMKWITFVSDRDGNENIYLMKSDGSSLRRLTDHTARDIHPYFSPDGRYILFNSDRGNGSLDIYRYTIADAKCERLTDTPADETCARYSPDMKDIVFLRNGRSGDDLFVLHLSNFLSENLSNTPLSTDGWPCYSNDGKWIYYSGRYNGSYCLFRISKKGGNPEKITTPEPGEDHARVSLSSDGKLMVYNSEIANSIGIVMCEI